MIGTSTVVGASAWPFHFGYERVTLAFPLPALPGTRTEPLRLPHQSGAFNGTWTTIGLPRAFRWGNAICATAEGAFESKITTANVSRPSPGLPTTPPRPERSSP